MLYESKYMRWRHSRPHMDHSLVDVGASLFKACVAPSGSLLTDSVTEAYGQALSAARKIRRDVVLVQVPNYDMLIELPKFMGFTVQTFRSIEELSERRLARSSAVVFSDPNNPTGVRLRRSDIEAISKKTMVVIDTAFDPSSWLNAGLTGVVVVSSCKKRYASDVAWVTCDDAKLSDVIKRNFFNVHKKRLQPSSTPAAFPEMQAHDEQLSIIADWHRWSLVHAAPGMPFCTVKMTERVECAFEQAGIRLASTKLFSCRPKIDGTHRISLTQEPRLIRNILAKVNV